MIDKIKDYIQVRLGYTKDEIFIKYLLKNIRKENKHRKWYVVIFLSVIINAIIFYKTYNGLFLMFLIISLIAFFELDLIQSGKLKDYKRRKEFGPYYKHYKKTKNKKV